MVHLSDVYKTLVKNEDDVLGMITYAIYKKHKVEYHEKLILRKGKITDADIKNFHNSLTDNSFINYHNSATGKLAQLTEEVLNTHRAKLIEDTQKNIVEVINKQKLDFDSMLSLQRTTLSNLEIKVNDLINDHKIQNNNFSWKVFGIGIIQNVIASLIWLIIIFLIVVSFVDEEKKESIVKQGQKIFLGKEMPDSTK